MTTEALEQSPYSPEARMAAAVASLGDDAGGAEGAAEEGGGQAPAAEPAAAKVVETPTPDEPDPYDPAELQRIATKRAKERSAKPEPTPAPTAPAVDMSKLAEALHRPTREADALKALEAGDVTAAAKLLGTDPGSLTEKVLAQGLEPGTVKLQQQIEAQQAKIDKLEALISGDERAVATPDDVAKRFEEERHRMYVDDLTRSYERLSVDSERFPLQARLAKVDQHLMMEYASRADTLLANARGPEGRFGITAEEIAEVAERELRKIAQTFGGASSQGAGEKSAAGTATDASNRGVGTLSNASASETASAPADPYDMSERRRRALAALEEE